MHFQVHESWFMSSNTAIYILFTSVSMFLLLNHNSYYTKIVSSAHAVNKILNLHFAAANPRSSSTQQESRSIYPAVFLSSRHFNHQLHAQAQSSGQLKISITSSTQWNESSPTVFNHRQSNDSCCILTLFSGNHRSHLHTGRSFKTHAEKIPLIGIYSSTQAAVSSLLQRISLELGKNQGL